MISHETLERFHSLTPRWKAILVLSIIFLFLIGIYLIFQWGKSHGKVIVNSRLQQERDDSLIREEGIRTEAEKLAGINDLLKAQAKAQAELLTQAEAKRNQENAEKLKQIFEDREKKLEKIESETDVKNHIRELCNEVKNTGYQLSDKFCSQAN